MIEAGEKTRYFEIAGNDEGKSIEPYIVKTDVYGDIDDHLVERGDMSRYYKEVSVYDYIKYLESKV